MKISIYVFVLFHIFNFIYKFSVETNEPKFFLAFSEETLLTLIPILLLPLFLIPQQKLLPNIKQMLLIFINKLAIERKWIFMLFLLIMKTRKTSLC